MQAEDVFFGLFLQRNLLEPFTFNQHSTPAFYSLYIILSIFWVRLAADAAEKKWQHHLKNGNTSIGSQRTCVPLQTATRPPGFHPQRFPFTHEDVGWKMKRSFGVYSSRFEQRLSQLWALPWAYPHELHVDSHVFEAVWFIGETVRAWEWLLVAVAWERTTLFGAENFHNNCDP